MVVLGIDPGYAIVGWGVVCYARNTYKPLGFGAITTDADMTFNSRLEYIYTNTYRLIEKAKPDALAIEKLYFQNNQKTAINVAQARGVITLSAQNYGKDIFEYTPLQVKQSVTGYGRAEKKQVQEMIKNILGLDSVPKPDDTADALAMAICHGHVSGSSIGRLNAILNR